MGSMADPTPEHDDHDMGEGHEATALGPIDITMWGAAILGIALGLVVLLGFVWALR
jgi:hypothetical protein